MLSFTNVLTRGAPHCAYLAHLAASLADLGRPFGCLFRRDVLVVLPPRELLDRFEDEREEVPQALGDWPRWLGAPWQLPLPEQLLPLLGRHHGRVDVARR